jgi:hypothetical protein
MARFSEKDIIKSVKASVEILKFFSEYNKDKSKDDKINTKIGIFMGCCLEISGIGNTVNDLMRILVDNVSRIQLLAKTTQILIYNKLKKKINLLTKDQKVKQLVKNLNFF